VSLTVQKAPSSHVVLFAFAGCVQAVPLHTSLVHGLPSSAQLPVRGVKTQPDDGLHVSVVHSRPSSQTSVVPGWQTPPASHASSTVHALLSVQLEPGASGGFEQVSPPSSHVSDVHGFVSAQFRGPPPVQRPL
jgi:hypothetical protein